MKDDVGGDLAALLSARIEGAINERREVFALPIDLVKVRAYFRARDGHQIAALPDAVLLVAVHLARLFDPFIAPVDRARSEAWLLTEGAKLTANPAVRAAIESLAIHTATPPLLN